MHSAAIKSFTLTYHVHAIVSHVWSNLTEPKEMEKWGAGLTKMKALEGNSFSLWERNLWYEY